MGEVWPKFFYHADCIEGRKFESAESVPAGWVTGPHLVVRRPIVKPTPLPSYPDDDLEDSDGSDPTAEQMDSDAAPARRGRPRKNKE